VQRHLSLVRDAIADGPFEFRSQRQHGAKHFAKRREIVVRDPLSKLDKLFIEYGTSIEHAEDIFDLHLWRTIMQRGDHSRHALLAKRYQHAPTCHGLHPVRDAVGERSVQRHGERDVTEFGHRETGLAYWHRNIGAETNHAIA